MGTAREAKCSHLVFIILGFDSSSLGRCGSELKERPIVAPRGGAFSGLFFCFVAVAVNAGKSFGHLCKDGDIVRASLASLGFMQVNVAV